MAYKDNKESIRAKNKKWRDKNKSYMKEYFIKNPEKLKRSRLMVTKWKEKNRDKVKSYPWAKYTAKYEREHPKEEFKFKAREKARNNIPLGGLCENCNINKADQRHHPDYSKPLEVILLCKKCHTAIHG